MGSDHHLVLETSKKRREMERQFQTPHVVEITPDTARRSVRPNKPGSSHPAPAESPLRRQKRVGRDAPDTRD